MKPIGQELVDQAAHFGIAAVVVAAEALISGSTSWQSGAFVGLVLGLVREVTEGGQFGPGSWRDLLFWTLGGAAAGWVF